MTVWVASTPVFRCSRRLGVSARAPPACDLKILSTLVLFWTPVRDELEGIFSKNSLMYEFAIKRQSPRAPSGVQRHRREPLDGQSSLLNVLPSDGCSSFRKRIIKHVHFCLRSPGRERVQYWDIDVKIVGFQQRTAADGERQRNMFSCGRCCFKWLGHHRSATVDVDPVV